MRPIKLVVQAFGPFAAREEVDFRDAVGAGLFGIYGPTGAGKSSIFSAITFALFGQAAKDEQAISSLRSDHAPPDCLTQVELLFEIGSKLYYVRRQPDQERPKTRGEGFTKDQHAAWLFDATGIDVDSITPENCGKVIAEKKVGQVGTAIRDLLGYGPEQFRQIVLLPQGRFERFLASKSDDRLEILRELFDVSLYRRLTAKLIDDAREAEKEVRHGRELYVGRLQQEGCESADALASAIKEAAGAVESRTKEAKLAREQFNTANDSFAKAKALEERFAAHESAAATLARVEAEAPAIAQLRQRLERARLAQSMGPHETELVRSTELVRKASEAFSRAEATEEKARLRLAEASSQLTAALAGAEETARLKEELVELGRHDQTLATSEGLRRQAQLKQATFSDAQEELYAARDRLVQLKLEQSTKAETLSAVRITEAKRILLQQQRKDVRSALAQARLHQDLRRRAMEADHAKSAAQNKVVLATAERKTAQAEFDRAQLRLSKVQAQLLAHQLVPGEPCLVCGSREHPVPAVGEGNSRALERAAAEAHALLDEKRTAESEALAEAASADAVASERQQAVAGLSAPEEPLEALEKREAEHTADLEGLDAPSDLAQLEADVGDLAAQILAVEASRDAAIEQAQGARTAAAVASQALLAAIDTVPENFRDPEALAREKERLSEEVASCERKLKQAQEEEKAATAQLATSEQSLRDAVRHKEVGAADLVQRTKHFEGQLEGTGLSREEYEGCKGDIEQIADMATRAQEFDRRLNEARGSAQQAASAIKDAERPDLQTFEATRDERASAVSNADDALAASRARAETLRKLAAALHQELERLNALEAETGALRALAAAFGGENPVRTTLESYAIGTMFDQVLAAANLRLAPMSSGQYHLERNQEVVGGRGKRGLDIRVHDTHTGRAREISTLSGGETFIAALALALGLSDVVESSSGNIRLDTIFIDEGFGSLDTENDSGTLDRVLQVLQDIVGRNRAVGLISHVPLVQQAIPNGFTVRKTLNGSSIEVRH